MAIYMWREPENRQYLTKQYTGTGENTTYYYGVCFTPKQNCTLDKVWFLGNSNIAGILKVVQGMKASQSGTTYTVAQSDIVDGVYTLPTSYSLTADTQYVVCFKANATGVYLNNSIDFSYPLESDTVTFNYATYSNSSSELTNFAYCVCGIYLSYA